MFRSLLLAVALAVHAAASATSVTAHYSSLGGDDWTVSFTIHNDGTLPSIGGFTIYFPETEFAALSHDGSPATWDSLVIQPDLGIPAAGFLDAFAIDAGDRLVAGESIGGFVVGFNFLGLGTPGSLAFDIVDDNFQVVDHGFTSVSGGPKNTIPEPATLALTLLGFAGAIFLRRAATTSAFLAKT